MPSQSIFGEAPEEAREENAVEIYDPSTGELQDDRSRDLLNVVLDPKPFQRWRWERARIIKDARRGWRISKEDYLKRTERQCVENSVWLKTSVKKLSLLARMLAGKNIDEALLQLRFSKKRTADEVAKHLEHARDMAIVKWGMGLGEVEDRKGDPIEIRLKDGTKKMITDRTAIYIEQAMVQRGSYELQAEIRARGKTNFLRKPYSGELLFLCVLLNDMLIRISSHTICAQRGAHENPRISGAGREEAAEKAVHTSSRQAYHAAKAVYLVVESSTWYCIKPCTLVIYTCIILFALSLSLPMFAI